MIFANSIICFLLYISLIKMMNRSDYEWSPSRTFSLRGLSWHLAFDSNKQLYPAARTRMQWRTSNVDACIRYIRHTTLDVLFTNCISFPSMRRRWSTLLKCDDNITHIYLNILFPCILVAHNILIYLIWILKFQFIYIVAKQQWVT